MTRPYNRRKPLGNTAVPPSSAGEAAARYAADAQVIPTGFRPAIAAPRGFRFAQFRNAVPFMAVNGTTDGAFTARVGEPIVRDAARVAEIVETTEAGGCLAFSLDPDARTGVVQVRLVPYSNVICVVRV